MTVAVNVTENVEWLEVEGREVFDQPREAIGIIQEQLKNRVRNELKRVLEQTLEAEADHQIGAIRYERGVLGRRDVRNGHRDRWVSTSLGTVELRVPRARKVELSFTVFEAYRRRWRELDGLLLEAYIGGMSCRGVGERVAGLLGGRWSATTIAKLVKELEASLLAFRQHTLKDEYEALIMDGMYLRLRQCGKQKRPVVAVLGIKADGSVELLALKVCYSENSMEVEGVLKDLKERGLFGGRLKMVTIDEDKGLEAAVHAVYGQVRIQACVFHKINRLHQNTESKKQGRRMMTEASTAFSKTEVRQQRKALRTFCNRWRSKEPRAIHCFEHQLERCFEVHQLPPDLRSKASTTNLCEGLFKQIRARTNKIGAFESPMAVERFVFAIVCQKAWINIPGRIPAGPLIQLKSPHSS
jgi:transposase-like protein